MGDQPAFSDYLRTHLARLDWTPADLARHSGIGQTIISRWLNEGRAPGVENARALADTIGRPLLEVLVAAGIITGKEARQRVTTADATRLTDDELVLELRRRIKVASVHAAPTRQQVESDPERYASVNTPTRGENANE